MAQFFQMPGHAITRQHKCALEGWLAATWQACLPRRG